ncbi:DNA primase, large subunit [Boletus edulis]|nr:DNA primase, large subunit [Boletus edulis]
MFRNRERTQPGVKQSKRSGQTTSTPTTESYPFRLNFYDTPPRHEVTLEDFETCALDRLRVLAEIESSFARNRSWDELKTVTDAQCKKYLPLNSNTALTVNLEEQRPKRSYWEELRRRFVKAETTLFRVRYDADSPTDRSAFLERQRFDWEKMKRDRFAKELTALEKPVTSDSKNWSTEYHKVPWIRVPDLVAKRRVFLSGGYAYVSSHEVSSFVFNEFERKLQLALEYTAKMLPRLDEDTRLIPILNNLSQGFLAGVPSDWVNPSATGDEIRADMECLVRDRHLKHFGRLQYGLFLKVLGLSIDEAIAFWKKSLSTIADDRFNKEYRYNIRHSYGLEGKRANYPAKSCQQILTSDKPGVGDCHGCPYRHFSPENLQTGLLAVYSSQGLTANDLHEVMRTVKEGHYHVACTRVFEITHASRGVKKGEGIGGGDSVVHPNQYAARSIELEKSQREDAMAVES